MKLAPIIDNEMAVVLIVEASALDPTRAVNEARMKSASDAEIADKKKIHERSS